MNGAVRTVWLQRKERERKREKKRERKGKHEKGRERKEKVRSGWKRMGRRSRWG